jgi:hypothetical protein
VNGLEDNATFMVAFPSRATEAQRRRYGRATPGRLHFRHDPAKRIVPQCGQEVVVMGGAVPRCDRCHHRHGGWVSVAAMSGHEVLFTGSVPLQPAAAVFEALQRHCGPHLRRMPDGEQLDWVFGAWQALMAHPAIEVSEGELITTADTPFGSMRSPLFAVRDGATVRDIRLEHFGIADAVEESYRQLRELKARGVVPEHVRLQATLASPGTTGGPLVLPWNEVVCVVNPPLIEEVARIAAVVPHDELAIQIDIPSEIEMEEWRRNPTGFDVPFAAALDRTWGAWTLETLMEANAEIADQVPSGAELGFHLCGLWHMDPRGGQDVQVHVDAANLLTEQISRRIDYLHLPMLPEHGPEDYAKLAGLRLSPETKLFLGILHRGDGVEGVRQRLELAAAVVDDFGIGHFCGLRDLNQVGTEGLDELLELHGQAARL